MQDSDNTIERDVVEEMELSDESERSNMTKKLTLAAVFAALSIAIAPIALYIPRIPLWGIALFDPVSLFWIIAFLLGGGWVGLICMGAGTLALFFFDPTVVGPLLKFVATLPLIVIPWLGVRSSLNGGTRAPISKIPIIGKKITSEMSEGDRLSKPSVYLTLMVPAFLLRLILMIPLNLVIVPLLFPVITDVGFIIGYTIVLNSMQSIFDVVIPYVTVYPTKIFKHFKLW